MAHPFSLVLTILLPLAACAADGANLVTNPGFEIGEASRATPAGWRFAWEVTHSDDKTRARHKQQPQFKWDDSETHSGRRSLFISNQRKEDDGVWSLDGVPLPPETKFLKLQAWIKTRGLQGTRALVSVVFLGEKRKYLAANYEAIAADTDRDWTRYTGYLSPPPGTQTLRIRLWLNMRYSGTGAVWFDDLSLVTTDRIERLIQRYEDDRPMPELTAKERQKGYVCYTRNYLRLVFPTSVPDREEIGRPLDFFAVPGEREPVTFAIRAVKGLKGVRVTCTALAADRAAAIPAEQITVRPVRYGKKQGQSRWGTFQSDEMVVPLYLASKEQVDVAAGSSQQYWITVHVPDDAPPGHYRGTVTVRAEDAAPTELPIRLEVFPIKLREPKGIFFGMYHRPVGDDDFAPRPGATCASTV